MNTILTNIGEQLASNGFITGVMPKISKVWFGDGGGSIITPTKDTTQLVNKITEGVGTTILRLGEPNRLYIYTQIPNIIGDFTVREIGLLTEDDILIAYGGGFEQYKPPVNVSSDRFDYYITIPLSSTQDITINFTNDNEYAPQESVDVVQNGLEARRLEILDINNRMPNKVEYSDIVDNVVTSNSNKPLSAKQGKVLKDLVDTKQDIIQDNTLAINKLNISGGTEVNADLVDGDTFIVDDGNNNTVRKSLISRIWTYINSKLTGAISTVVTSNLTGSRVVVSDGNGKIGVSGVTATELGYLSGTSSSIQTQLNGKAATNQTMYIGTTAVAINRASASLALTGISIDGNAGSADIATKLQTARTITLSGDVSGNTSFDGSGNVTLVATVANDSHTHAFTNLTSKPTTLQGYDINPEELPADIKLDTKTITGLYSQSQNAEATLTLNYPVAEAGLLEVFAYSGMIHQRYWVYRSDDVYYRAKYNTGAWTPWTKGANVDDTVAAATKLATARTIAISGAVTGTATSFDGTGNISIPVTELNASNLSSGTVPDARLSGVYSGMSLKLNGNNTVFNTESSGSTNISRTVYGLAEYKNNGGTTTGAIVFIAPSTSLDIMHQLEVSGLLYNQNIVSLIVQGYRTSGGWSDLRKISTGTVDIQVRWGVTPDGNNCLILGDVGTVWSYPHIAITRAMFSYIGLSDIYCTGWTVALVTDFTGYTNISATISDSTMIGNVSTATKLATARTINGTSFDGTVNITTANWGTARTITIGATGKSVDGSGNVSWAHTEIGVVADTANTLALRDLLGDLTARLFRSTYTNEANINNSSAVMMRVNNSSDNVIRSITPAGFKVWMDVNNILDDILPSSGGVIGMIDFNGSSMVINKKTGIVSGVTRTSTGWFTVTLSGNTSTDYVCAISHNGGAQGYGVYISSRTATEIKLETGYGGDNTTGRFNPSIVGLVIFGA